MHERLRMGLCKGESKVFPPLFAAVMGLAVITACTMTPLGVSQDQVAAESQRLKQELRIGESKADAMGRIDGIPLRIEKQAWPTGELEVVYYNLPAILAIPAWQRWTADGKMFMRTQRPGETLFWMAFQNDR